MGVFMLAHQIVFTAMTIFFMIIGCTLVLAVALVDYKKEFSNNVHTLFGFTSNFRLSMSHLVFWFIYIAYALRLHVFDIPYATIYVFGTPLAIRILMSILSARLGYFKY